MRFFERDFNSATLFKDDETKIDFSCGELFRYTGIYYKKKDNPDNEYDLDEIPTTFIGKYICYKGKKSYYDTEMNIVGVYFRPEYILLNNEWYKIINYKEPQKKYFLYPHLICNSSLDFHHKALPYAHTIEKIQSLDINIVGEKELEHIY